MTSFRFFIRLFLAAAVQALSEVFSVLRNGEISRDVLRISALNAPLVSFLSKCPRQPLPQLLRRRSGALRAVYFLLSALSGKMQMRIAVFGPHRGEKTCGMPDGAGLLVSGQPRFQDGDRSILKTAISLPRLRHQDFGHDFYGQWLLFRTLDINEEKNPK